MADENKIHQGSESSCDSSENSSHEKWTLIGKTDSEKEDTDEDMNGAGAVDEAQEPRVSMEVITAPYDDGIDDQAGSLIFEKQGDESDGISVITESEAEQLVVRRTLGEIDDCRNHSCGVLRVYEKPGEKTTPQVATILNVVIACSLAAIIGLGAGRILGMDDKCPVANAVDFSSLRTESDMLINQIKELTEVKAVLDEIKASIPYTKAVYQQSSKRRSKSRSKRFEEPEEQLKIAETYVFDPDVKILEQLQTSLNTLCAVIDGVNADNDFVKLDTSKTQDVVEDLMKFKKIIRAVVEEFKDTGRSRELEFFRNAEKKIRDVCKSLLSDLSYAVHRLTMKIHQKLNKVRNKLNQRLCVLKNSGSMDGQVFLSLDENNSFLQSCDKILNVTLKPSSRTVKMSEQEITDKKIHRTTNKLKKRPPRKSKHDIYPGNSSSDSSMPDVDYDSDGFRKEKETFHRREKDGKFKSTKIQSRNDSKRRKIQSTMSTKSSSGKSLRKSMIEILVPEQSCPLIPEHHSESASVYKDTPSFEASISNRKPLYSTILKSDINWIKSEPDDFDEKKLFEKTPADASEGIDQQLRVEVSEAKKNSVETKHDITPAESGININAVKGVKKEPRNDKIRRPNIKSNGLIEEDGDTLGREDISIKKYRNPERLESVDKVPPQAGAVKHCRKDNKCYNHSVLEMGSSKRPASSTNSPDDIKSKKRSADHNANKKTEKMRNDDGKRFKKVKPERKTPPQSKITASKMNKSSKRRKDTLETNDQVMGDWQLQRSRAREMRRNGNHRSEWFFDRAGSRQDARKNMDAGVPSMKWNRRDKHESIFEDWMKDEEFFDYSREAKDVNGKKHSVKSRAGFTAKKRPHRNNIFQSKRR